MYRLLRWYCSSDKLRQTLVEIQNNTMPLSFPTVLQHTAKEAEELHKLLEYAYRSKDAVSKLPLDRIDDYASDLLDYFPISKIPSIVKFFGRYKQSSKFLKESYPHIRNNLDSYTSTELIDIASGLSKSIASSDKKFFSEIYRRIKTDIPTQNLHNINLLLQTYSRIDFKSADLYQTIEKTFYDNFHQANDLYIYQCFKVLAEKGYVSSELAKKVEEKFKVDFKEKNPIYLQYMLDGYAALKYKNHDILDLIHYEMSKLLVRFDHDTAIGLMNTYASFEDIPEENKSAMLARIINIHKVESLRDSSLINILNIAHKLNQSQVVYSMYEDEILKRIPKCSLYFLASMSEALASAGITSDVAWKKIEELAVAGAKKFPCAVISRVLLSFHKIGYPDYIYSQFTDRICSFRYIDTREYLRFMEIYLSHPDPKWKVFLFNTFKKVIHVINTDVAQTHLNAFSGMEEVELKKLKSYLNTKQSRGLRAE